MANLDPVIQVRVCAERCMLTWRQAVTSGCEDCWLGSRDSGKRVCAERCMLIWRQAVTSGCEDCWPGSRDSKGVSWLGHREIPTAVKTADLNAGIQVGVCGDRCELIGTQRDTSCHGECWPWRKNLWQKVCVNNRKTDAYTHKECGLGG